MGVPQFAPSFDIATAYLSGESRSATDYRAISYLPRKPRLGRIDAERVFPVFAAQAGDIGGTRERDAGEHGRGGHQASR